jgi:CubicO group peptidase (beta-lactamase class C family)
MMPYQEIQFAPDTRYGYSNPGYVYLARVVEAITGDPWQSYIYKNVWLPLGITSSYFGLTPWAARQQRSHNYALVRDSATGALRRVDHGAEFDPGITIPNGGWNGPIGDVAKWVAALPSQSGIEDLWRPRHAVSGYDAGADSMGLGFFIYSQGGERLIGHTGHQANFRSFFLLNPRTRRAIVAVFNTTNDAQPEASERGWRAIMARARQLLRER